MESDDEGEEFVEFRNIDDDELIDSMSEDDSDEEEEIKNKSTFNKKKAILQQELDSSQFFNPLSKTKMKQLKIHPDFSCNFDSAKAEINSWLFQNSDIKAPIPLLRKHRDKSISQLNAKFNERAVDIEHKLFLRFRYNFEYYLEKINLLSDCEIDINQYTDEQLIGMKNEMLFNIEDSEDISLDKKKEMFASLHSVFKIESGIPCKKCKLSEHVFEMFKQTRRGDEAETGFYCCVKCDIKWRV